MSQITMNVTGLDTETLINELMNVERRPLLLLQSKQQTISVKKSAWDEISKKLLSLTAKIESLTLDSEFYSVSSTVKDSAVLKVTGAANAHTGTYSVEIRSLAKSQVVTSAGFSHEDPALGLSGEVFLNGEAFFVSEEDTLRDIAQKINSGENGVGATILNVSEGEVRLSLTAQKTGLENEMVFSGDDLIWESLGIVNELGEANQTVSAKDAVFSINGIEFIRAQNTVTDAVSGLTLELLQEKNQALGVQGETVFEIAEDNKKSADLLKAVIDEYNGFLDVTKKYTGWDAEAKVGGLLFGDPLLTRLTSEVRQVIFDQVGGNFPGFSFVGQMGISTGKKYSPDGKLFFDKDVFLAALESDKKGAGDFLGVCEKYGDSDGVFSRLKDAIVKYTDSGGFLPLRQEQLGKEDKMLERQIEDKQRILDMRLESLKKQFSALEVLLQQMNAQGLWLSQQLAGLNFGKS